MKQIFAICILTLLISQTQAAICDNYKNKVPKSEIILTFSNLFDCISKKSEELDKLKKDGQFSLEALQKYIDGAKLDCFNEVKEPSEKLKDLFQCYKNHYETKFGTTVKIPTLEDQKKGTGIESWGDKELEQKIEEEHQDRNSTTNVALYIFCIVLGIAIVALLVAIIFSKYRMHVNKEQASLGQTSYEFGSSNSNYQKQTDF